MPTGKTTKTEAEKLLTFIGVNPGWRVLDMAAGAGYNTELIARAMRSTTKLRKSLPPA